MRIGVPPYDDARDPETGILNPQGIAAVARDVASAADAALDLAVATGRGPDLLTDLDGLRPLVRDEDVALVGYRVVDDNDGIRDWRRPRPAGLAGLSWRAHGRRPLRSCPAEYRDCPVQKPDAGRLRSGQDVLQVLEEGLMPPRRRWVAISRASSSLSSMIKTRTGIMPSILIAILVSAG